MKLLIDKIIDYLDYLRNFLHLKVSFCNIGGYFKEYIHLLQPYNRHLNAYCFHIKNNPKFFQTCIEKQHLVLQKCGGEAFYGSCWAGEEEYVFPIKGENTAIGFISVYGYRGQLAHSEEKMKNVCKKYGIDSAVLEKNYFSGLTEQVPSLNSLSPVIYPLCAMFELLYLQMPKNIAQYSESSSLYAELVNYLCYNYNKNISLDKIAAHMNYSKSYIRQLFYKQAGKTIFQYINLLRINNAKEMLSSTSMPIGEISEKLGFCNSNYFSNVFKKSTGLKPLEYRKQNTSLFERQILNSFNRP